MSVCVHYFFLKKKKKKKKKRKKRKKMDTTELKNLRENILKCVIEIKSCRKAHNKDMEEYWIQLLNTSLESEKIIEKSIHKDDDTLVPIKHEFKNLGRSLDAEIEVGDYLSCEKCGHVSYSKGELKDICLD